MTIEGGREAANPKTWAIVIWALFIASFFTLFITSIIGVIVAYVKRGDLADTPFASHMTSAIRTFWISLIVGLIGFSLAFVMIGIPLLLALLVWQLFRCIRGLIRAVDGKPIVNPLGWF